jgi:hypothetical protein
VQLLAGLAWQAHDVAASLQTAAAQHQHHTCQHWPRHVYYSHKPSGMISHEALMDQRQAHP